MRDSENTFQVPVLVLLLLLLINNTMFLFPIASAFVPQRVARTILRTRVFSSSIIQEREPADFASLGIRSPLLLQRLEKNLQLQKPTAVQAASFFAIAEGGDVTIGSETGSGKTLAYLLPLIDDILQRKARGKDELGYEYARALILVPNKELVQQVVRMAIGLTGGKASIVFGGPALSDNTIMKDSESSIPPADQVVRLAVMPGGLRSPFDFEPFRKSPPPVDLVISTPASVGPLGLSPQNIEMFSDIRTVVVDEADMLLDGGYIRQLENVFMGFRRADRLDTATTRTQHVFVAATLPDYGLRSVDAYLRKKFPRSSLVTLDGMHNARHSGLQEQTQWIQEESKKERMAQLVSMLSKNDDNEKVMVFLNTVGEVEAATQALLRNGKNALPYHAKISIEERPSTLDRFRRFQPGTPKDDNDDTVPILVCTDLASRGLDIPGVTTVVQLQFSTNVVAHLHRMGRCGRAGNKTGKGVVFYGEQEKDLVKAVQMAEEQQSRMVLQQDVLDLDETSAGERAGKVTNAFSRKRGFRKKRKKMEEASAAES